MLPAFETGYGADRPDPTHLNSIQQGVAGVTAGNLEKGVMP